MSKRLILVLVVLMLVSPVLAKYSGGTGDVNDPYQIANVNDLLAISEDANFILTADIDFENQELDSSICNFSGNLNGNHYTISNVIFCEGGVFGSVNGVIENLCLDNITVNEGSFYSFQGTGTLANENYGLIRNCNVTNSEIISSTFYYAGGLIGVNRGHIENCSFQGEIYSPRGTVGGLMGRNLGSSDSIIRNCFTDCYI